MSSQQTITQILGKEKFIKADLLLKAKELKIKGYSTLSVAALSDAIVNIINNPQAPSSSQPSTDEQVATEQKLAGEIQHGTSSAKKKKTIPKVLKNSVWDKYIGQDKGIGNCFSCQANIDSKHFECGHIISEQEGGDITLDNLRPVCGLCNKSMGTVNMHDFIQKLKSNSKLIDIRDIAKDCGFIFELPPQKQNAYSYSNIPIFELPRMRGYKTEYDDESLIAKINYSTLNFDFLKTAKIYCRVEKIKNFLAKYNITSEEDILYITIPRQHIVMNQYDDFCKINIEKMIAKLISSGQIIIDADLQKIKTHTVDEIDKSEIIETCNCPHQLFRNMTNVYNDMEEYNRFNRGLNISGYSIINYNCQSCGKVIKGNENKYKLQLTHNTDFRW